jgi:phosphoribosylformylglycinamidine (FGAM) synthase-like amidotransferase family enzyme
VKIIRGKADFGLDLHQGLLDCERSFKAEERRGLLVKPVWHSSFYNSTNNKNFLGLTSSDGFSLLDFLRAKARQAVASMDNCSSF